MDISSESIQLNVLPLMTTIHTSYHTYSYSDTEYIDEKAGLDYC